ncbi:MAG TPA: SPOR domain-containing protein, partial [Thermodesulfobacteriota bacterium]|nr:SPOR domain-containing protein [Thermodesulfobacteriota bacterium]
MSNERLIALFFGFVILFIIAFSLGINVGKRLAENRETQVVVKENNQDPWALSRGSEEGGEPTGSEEEKEMAYQTPSSQPTEELTDTTVTEPEETPEAVREGESLAEESPALKQEGGEEGVETAKQEKQKPSYVEVQSELEAEKKEGPKMAAAPLTQTGPTYTIQIGSFKVEEEANRVTGVLKSKGYPAFTERTDIAGKGTWYRVKIGTFKTKEEAKLYGDDLMNREPLVKS